MSRVVRKPAFRICENKDADQLRGNHEADQRLCFRYTDSTIPLLPKSEISSVQPSSVAVQPGLCQTWSETPKTGFLTTRLISANTSKKVLLPLTTDSNITTPDGDMQTPNLNYLSPDRKTSQPDKITSSASKIQAINANNVLPDKKMLYPHVKMEKLDIFQTKLTDEEHTPHITGCVLMPSTEIVVCDFYNRKVKLFDQSRKITDSIRLPWAPRDLSLVDDETVTVTIPSIRRIQYVKVFPKMKAFCVIQLDQCLERQETIRSI